MPDLPPYVEVRDFLPVRALIRGEQHDGRVRGWRGDPVCRTWSLGPGLNHLGWVLAGDVERPGLEGRVPALTVLDGQGGALRAC